MSISMTSEESKPIESAKIEISCKVVKKITPVFNVCTYALPTRGISKTGVTFLNKKNRSIESGPNKLFANFSHNFTSHMALRKLN